MKHDEQLKQLDKLLSEAFTEVKDNYGIMKPPKEDKNNEI